MFLSFFKRNIVSAYRVSDKSKKISFNNASDYSDWIKVQSLENTQINDSFFSPKHITLNDQTCSHPL